MELREVAWSDPRGEALRTAQRAELAIRYETPDSEPGPAPTAADITVFFVAFDTNATEASDAAGSEEAIGCGGLRQLGADYGEIKRMYVRPDHRGSGVSGAILHTLEAWARDHGWTRLVLETGERQPDAIRFYEREGYTRIPNFGHYVDSDISLCFARALD